MLAGQTYEFTAYCRAAVPDPPRRSKTCPLCLMRDRSPVVSRCNFCGVTDEELARAGLGARSTPWRRLGAIFNVIRSDVVQPLIRAVDIEGSEMWWDGLELVGQRPVSAVRPAVAPFRFVVRATYVGVAIPFVWYGGNAMPADTYPAVDAYPHDNQPDGCWATSFYDEDEACDRPAVDALGLCSAHREEKTATR